MKLPQNGQWVQTNRSDVQGNMQGSFNLDLTKVIGKTKVTRMIATNTGFNNVPFAFAAGSDGLIYSGAGNSSSLNGFIYHTANLHPRSAFVQDSGTGTPNIMDSLYSDIKLFNNAIYGTTYEGGGDRIVHGSSASWSYITGLGIQTGPHMLAVFGQRLYITIAGLSAIYSIDQSNSLATSGANTIALPDISERPVFILAASNKLYIGTMSFSDKGHVYEWDGTSSVQFNQISRLQSRGVWAGIVKDDTLYVIDSNGIFLQYSNGVFVEKGRLPLTRKNLVNATNVFTNNRPVHPNGISIVEGKIQILVNATIDDSTSSIEEYCPSGIWEYDDIIYDPYTGISQGVGLYHKYSFSYLPVGTNTVTDYGQESISIAGALAEMKNSDNNIAATGDLLAGAQIYTDASTTQNAIFTNDTFDATSGTTGQYSTDGYGIITTTKIPSQNIDDTFQKVYAFYKRLSTLTNYIAIKYRTFVVKSTAISLIWVAPYIFTTTTDLTGMVKYEVKIIQGTGGGKTAHIVSVINNSGTYTVTLDEAFTGVTTGTAKARVTNFLKLPTLANDLTSQVKPFGIEKSATWIQLRICMVFKNSDELEGLDLVNEVHKYVA